jgi:hypothetical protein
MWQNCYAVHIFPNYWSLFIAAENEDDSDSDTDTEDKGKHFHSYIILSHIIHYVIWFFVCSQVENETLEWYLWLTFRGGKRTLWFGAGRADLRDQHQTETDRGTGKVSKTDPVDAATLWRQTSSVTRTNQSHTGGTWHSPCFLQWVTGKNQAGHLFLI